MALTQIKWVDYHCRAEFTCARRFIGYSANSCIWMTDDEETPLVE
ncbi:MAG: hypothetical protein WBO06_13220 [Gammaproteobacteria bacterium]